MLLAYRQYHDSPAQYFYYLLYVILVLIAYFNRGWPELTKAIVALEPIPSTESVLLLLRCTRIFYAGKEAVGKIAEIIPLLDREQALAVGIAQWRRFYRRLDWETPERKLAAFQVANLVGDKDALPLLERLLQVGDIPEDMRGRLEAELNLLRQ